ncbi:MAG: MBL fold metallo-hydrolase RNA specificity domain-containing protein, partial [Candidatus Woesearchaeota archaeon]|nr:MBL fold metallo-hydrolase RNA specificity domain-containing protein [Candidatus Woesearchaeota archaeon]
TLVFSCYQAEGSLGKRIRDGEKEVTLRNGAKPETVQVNMDICKIDISDHSDRRQLMNYVFRCSPRPKKIIVNHGENSRVLDFASSIHKQGRIETVAPRNLETIRLR